MERSIVLTPLIPAAETDIEWFEKGVETFAKCGITVVEYYTDESQIEAYQKVLRKYGQKGIYLHAVCQKRQGINLSSIEESERLAAEVYAMHTAKICAAAGVDMMLITSGSRPKELSDLPAAKESLKRSLKKLAQAAEIPLLLEPGDTEVHMCQTIGTTDETIELMTELNSPNLFLTMDSSHIAQLGENVEEAIHKAAPWCSHVHLANCVLKQGHPLYGDRHPFFIQEDSVFSPEDLHDIMKKIPKLLGRNDYMVSVEVISQEPSAEKSINRMKQEAPWFFQ